jgi:hypothetical protein
MVGEVLVDELGVIPVTCVLSSSSSPAVLDILKGAETSNTFPAPSRLR